jgi:hypothetical protein
MANTLIFTILLITATLVSSSVLRTTSTAYVYETRPTIPQTYNQITNVHNSPGNYKALHMVTFSFTGMFTPH